MLTPEQAFAFDEWLGDMHEVGFGFGDFVVPLGALVGVYLVTDPLERTTYKFAHTVMEHQPTLNAMARLLDMHDNEDSYFENLEFDIPRDVGGSNIHGHLQKALWDGRPSSDTKISVADYQISTAVGKASYDFMIGFDPLKIRKTGYNVLYQLPRSYALIEAGNVL